MCFTGSINIYYKHKLPSKVKNSSDGNKKKQQEEIKILAPPEAFKAEQATESAALQLTDEALDFLVDLLMDINEGGNYYELNRNLEDAA